MDNTHLQRAATLPFTAWTHKGWMAEMPTQQLTLPAVSVANAVEVLALHAIWHLDIPVYRKRLGLKSHY